MSLLRYRAVGHSSRLEAADNALGGLDLIYRYTAVLVEVKVKQAPESELAVLARKPCGILLVGLIAACSCSLLQEMNGLGSVQMLALSAAELMSTCAPDAADCVESERVVGSGMEDLSASADIAERDASDTADRTCKVFVDELLRDADSLKELAALIGLYRGDAHF